MVAMATEGRAAGGARGLGVSSGEEPGCGGQGGARVRLGAEADGDIEEDG